MMERITEPELMDEEEQVKAYANKEYAFAHFSEPHDLFVNTFQEKFPDINSSFNDVVLDLGCGSCDITRQFAKAYKDASFHAVDGSALMLKYGKELNDKENLSHRIKLIETCLPKMDSSQQLYHLIISNSLLHHLHSPNTLWETIQQHAKPYAHVFVMDLIRPVDEQTVAYLTNEYAANEPEILKSDFENSLRAAFTVKEVRQQLDEMSWSNLRVEEISNCHMIIHGVLK